MLLFQGGKIVNELMEKAKSKNVKIHLPVDFIIADKFDEVIALCHVKNIRGALAVNRCFE